MELFQKVVDQSRIYDVIEHVGVKNHPETCQDEVVPCPRRKLQRQKLNPSQNRTVWQKSSMDGFLGHFWKVIAAANMKESPRIILQDYQGLKII